MIFQTEQKQPRGPDDCPTCHGVKTVMQILEGQGIVRGTCPTCLGDGRARPCPPSRPQKVQVMYQGQTDGCVEGYEIGGMLVVPGEEGVFYITRKMAMDFFGLVEPPQAGRRPTQAELSARGYADPCG